MTSDPVRALRQVRPRTILATVLFVALLVPAAWQGADAVALYLALAGAIVVGVRRGLTAAAVLIGGAVLAILVVGVVALASDPCLPFCSAADARETLLARLTPIAATLAWVGACLARQPLAARTGGGVSWLVLVLAFLAALTAASIAEASVTVTECHC